jgi:DNA topoisomerase-1
VIFSVYDSFGHVGELTDKQGLHSLYTFLASKIDRLEVNQLVNEGYTTPNRELLADLRSVSSPDGLQDTLDDLYRLARRCADIMIIAKYDPNQPRDERDRWTSEGDITKTPEFKEWFKDSKIVDENSKPLQVYHGTKREFTEFKPKYSDKLMFFTKDPNFASTWPVGSGGSGDLREPPEWAKDEIERMRALEKELYQKMMDPKIRENRYDFDKPEDLALYNEGKRNIEAEMIRQTGFKNWVDLEQRAGIRVMPVYLSVQKPFDPEKNYKEIEPYLAQDPNKKGLMDAGHHKHGNWLVYENEGMVNELKRLGYDGLWITESSTDPKQDTIAVFDSRQIKSVWNRGTFDPNDPDIMKRDVSGEARVPAGETGGGRWTTGGEMLEAKRVDGKLVTASGSQLPLHIQGLKIPPAWTNVKYSPDTNSALLATGVDKAGRMQYVYHAGFSADQAKAKFGRVAELDQKYDEIKAENERNRQSKDEKVRANADCMKLIMETGIRPGSTSDTKAKKQAYGATTLQGRHIYVGTTGNVRLRFVGKRGVDISLPVKGDLAEMLKTRAATAGNKGDIFNTNSSSLGEYANKLDGGGFTPKDYRTRLGCEVAADTIKHMRAPNNMKEYKKAVARVGQAVADQLGNTKTIALQSYINPSLFEKWQERI